MTVFNVASEDESLLNSVAINFEYWLLKVNASALIISWVE